MKSKKKQNILDASLGIYQVKLQEHLFCTVVRVAIKCDKEIVNELKMCHNSCSCSYFAIKLALQENYIMVTWWHFLYGNERSYTPGRACGHAAGYQLYLLTFNHIVTHDLCKNSPIYLKVPKDIANQKWQVNSIQIVGDIITI